MPLLTVDPVLTVDGSRMCNIDPQDPVAMYGMWSAFSKCSGIMENGKRLEYMSWRLWNHELLLAAPERRRKSSSARSNLQQQQRLRRPSSAANSKVPDLSSSVDSFSSEETTDDNDDAATDATTPADESRDPLEIHCVERSRTRENPITRVDLVNLVTSIKAKQDLKGPLSPLPMHTVQVSSPQTLLHPQQQHQHHHTHTKSSAAIVAAISPKAQIPQTPLSSQQVTPTALKRSSPKPVLRDSSGSFVGSAMSCAVGSFTSPAGASDLSAETNISSHSVVRGFKPGEGISTYRSQSQLAPIPSPLRASPRKSSTSTYIPRTRKQMFQIGAGSVEDESSIRSNMSPRAHSSQLAEQRKRESKKQTSFNEHITEIPKTTMSMLKPDDYDDGGAIESDESDSDVSESAIDEEDEDEDDDDEEAWEDEGEPEESQKEFVFQRVDSKANLSSRKSLLSDRVAEGQRAAQMQAEASRIGTTRRRSRTSNPHGPSVPASPEEESPLGSRNSVSKSKPISALGQSGIHPPCPPGPPALSPRSTRRNMLTTELGVSLRKNMLLERSHRNVFSAQAIQRRHTSSDVKNLSQFPAAVEASPQDANPSRKSSWNDYFSHGLGEYHQKGW